MKTIAATVVDYIKTKPYLSSALSDGIINLTSLARNIQDDIEERTKKPVKPGAIVMALKRISDTADFVQTKQIIKVLKNLGDITVRSSLVDYSFLISDSLLVAQSNLLKEIEQKKEVFYTSSRGVSESNIIVSQNIAPLVDELFKDENFLDEVIKLDGANDKISGFSKLTKEASGNCDISSDNGKLTIPWPKLASLSPNKGLPS
mgnify:CR=1 FL=1